MKIISNKTALKKTGVGMAIGLGIVPLFIAILILYLPTLGYDPVYGGEDIESIVYKGYQITSDDVAAIKSMKEMLSDLAMCGLIFGLIGAAIGFVMGAKNKSDSNEHSN